MFLEGDFVDEFLFPFPSLCMHGIIISNLLVCGYWKLGI